MLVLIILYSNNNKFFTRYFTKGELRELFTLDNPKYSTTQVQLEQMHSAQRKTDVGLDEHVAFLYSLGMYTLICYKLY